MERYIDADALENVVTTYNEESELPITRYEFKRIESVLYEFPTADVEPVKHGRWIKNDNGTYSCSECQSWIPNEQYYYARYCLHCGAKMDEAEE